MVINGDRRGSRSDPGPKKNFRVLEQRTLFVFVVYVFVIVVDAIITCDHAGLGSTRSAAGRSAAASSSAAGLGPEIGVHRLRRVALAGAAASCLHQ